jgi:hypothetical protein
MKQSRKMTASEPRDGSDKSTAASEKEQVLKQREMQKV